MNYKVLIILVLSLTFNLSYAQKAKNNSVKLESIGANYEGETKKGVANGKGKAIGKEDTYEGEFKKGLPHGEGTYTWGNGDVYIGEFSKGKMDGKGKLIVLGVDKLASITKEGFFKDNEYIGIYKDPYKIIADGGVRNVNFQNKGGDLSQVIFEVFSNGRPVSSNILRIRDDNNSLVQIVNGYKTITNVNFPLERVEVSFSVDKASYKLIFDVYQKGNWHVIISV